MHDNDRIDGGAASHTRLFELASEQGGYFAAAQAGASGFSKALLAYHAKSGRFLRLRQGLYRLREYPSSPRENVIAAWVAMGKDVAVVSHESALEILGLSDLVARTVEFSSTMKYSMRHGKWNGVECGRTERIGNLGALAAATGGASQAGADAAVAR